MPKKVKKSLKPRVVPVEWVGFSNRLKEAVNYRRRESPNLLQNDIAEAAGVDSGNFAKMLAGEKIHVTGPTIIRLAKALRVFSGWLLAGEGPSGLGPLDAQKFVGSAPLAARNELVEAPSKGEGKRSLNVVSGTVTKRAKKNGS